MTARDAGSQNSFFPVALTILLAGVAISLVQFEIPSLLGQVMDYYGMGITAASWLMSIFTLVGIVFSVPLGRLAVQTSSRFMLAGGLALGILGSIISVFAANGAVLLICRAIEGVGLVAITLGGPLAIGDYIDVEHRGAATGVWGSYSVGSVIAETAAPIIYAVAGLQAVWAAMAAVCLVGIVVIFVVLRHTRFVTGTIGSQVYTAKGPEDETVGVRSEPESAPTPEPVGQLSAPKLRDVLRRDVILHILGVAFYDVVLLCLISYAPLALQQQGMDAALSGFVATLPLLCTPIISPICGVILDKFGHAKVLYLVGCIVCGPCAFVILTQSGPIIWIAALVFGIACSGIYPIFLTSFPTVLGSHRLMPLGMGVTNLATSIGLFLGTFLPPFFLGADGNNWLACAFLALAFCVAATVSVMLARFK